MKQILQNLGDGEIKQVEIPTPKVGRQDVLIRTTKTLVSAGTERMLLKFGKANLLQKARQQPEKVKMVLEKIKTDGLLTTLDAVRTKLDQPLALGYCNVGVVIDVGDDVSGISIGDRVISNGPHAEIVRVSKNLCAKVPDNVDDEQAVFTVLSSIALQGIRLAKPTLGEVFVVTGLGLIGLITVQLLRANGCQVIGIDFSPARCELAEQYGATTVCLSQGQNPITVAEKISDGHGVDGVLITASTDSNEPVHQAAQMCRKRGRIVLVGVTGLELSRADFYEKELSFQVSCSYGPGRYEKSYEEDGLDYPIGFVRWTEQRNFNAILGLFESQAINVKPLISHTLAASDYERAYALLGGDADTLGIILEYPELAPEDIMKKEVMIKPEASEIRPIVEGDVSVGFIGAGNYASRMLIPAFKKAGAQLNTLVSSGGVSGVHHGKKQGFIKTATDATTVFKNASVNAVVIATRHDSHAEFVCEALQAGKHVFVEKPLAINSDELEKIKSVYLGLSQQGKAQPILTVGYNRRYAPLVVKLKGLLDKVSQPKSFIYTVNAGHIPKDHWTQDLKVGGGRIIGEACHFIDLLRYLCGSPITETFATQMGAVKGIEVRSDKSHILLNFADGSTGCIHYLANGGKAFPKERVEVFAGDAVIQLDNFRQLTSFGWSGFSKAKLFKQDKGHAQFAKAFTEAVKGNTPAPVEIDELFEVAQHTIEIADTLGEQ